MTRDQLYNALCAELTQRGIDYKKADVFGFLTAGWAGNDGNSVEDWADAWEEAQQHPAKT